MASTREPVRLPSTFISAFQNYTVTIWILHYEHSVSHEFHYVRSCREVDALFFV